MSNLLQLMKELGADAMLGDEYASDPQSVIRRFGLNAEERRALLDLDMEAVKRLSGMENGLYTTNITIKAFDMCAAESGRRANPWAAA
jgi:hypothetical protein